MLQFSMLSMKEIIEKLKDIVSQELGNIHVKDKDIASVLDIKYDTFRKIKQHNRVPFWEIMQFLAKRSLSINYFFFNQLPEALVEPTSKYIILKYHSSVTGSAGFGMMNYELEPEPLVVDKQMLDYIDSSYKYTEIIRASGNSMLPVIQEDSLIFVDTSVKNINNKNFYIIKANEELYIKQIVLVNDVYHARSLNKQYPDKKLEEFIVVGRVKAVLTKI